MKKQRLPFLFFKFLSSKNRVVSIVMAASVVNLSVACSYYLSKPSVPTTASFAESMKKAGISNRYIILHQGKKVIHLKDVILNEESKEITGNLEMVDYAHKLYALKKKQKSKGYSRAKVKKALELHLFLKDTSASLADTGPTIIPFADVARMDVYEPDIGRSIFTALGFTLGILAVIVILIVAAKSSCPFVYAGEPNDVAFVGELYPGAIIPSLQRTDYLPLPGFSPAGELYSVNITNELLEKQYTDLVELLVISHPENVDVLLDQHGNPNTIGKATPPENASSGLASVLKKDADAFAFGEKPTGTDMSNIDLTFKNPQNLHHAKLILKAKNSMWFEYVYGKFNEMFGSYFSRFQKEQRKSTTEKSVAWRNDQGIPLSVYVKSGNDWQLAERINTVGPMAYRDLVVPINLGENPEKFTEIRLECGYMFWEIDYAAIDYSPNIAVVIEQIKPVSAIDENGKHVAASLAKADRNYLEQPEIGNEVTLTYKLGPAPAGKTRSAFLKNSGYYEYIRNYSGKPDTEKLKTFRQKGALSRLSKALHDRVNSSNTDEIVLNHE